MNRLPLSALVPSVIDALPNGTKLEFHTSSKTRKFVQAWVIDRGEVTDRSFKVWFSENHLVGWFGMEYVTPTLAHMADTTQDYQPVMEVRVFTPEEWN